MKRWVASAATTLGEVLVQIGLDEITARQALTDGRIFVGRMRARSFDDRVAISDEVLVHEARAQVTLPDPFVLLRARGVVAVDKPSGMPTVPDLEGVSGTLIEATARAISRPIDTLHATSRLDRDVSGVVTFAEDERARARLADARARDAYRRLYLAIGTGDLARDRDRWTWGVARDRDPMRRKAVDDDSGKASSSRVAVMRRGRVGATHYVLLALAPETGRTHQLRVHAARAGVPLLGDALYGGGRRLTTSNGAVRSVARIALHCLAVDVDLEADLEANRGAHRGDDWKIRVRSPVPPELVALAKGAGLCQDTDDLLEEALRCSP